MDRKLNVVLSETAVEKEENERETKFVVEIKESVETYPADPRPVTVETKFKPLVIWPRPVEKEEKDNETKFVVEIKEDVNERVETYPADPRPVTVESKFKPLVVWPSPVEKEENESDTKFVVEIKESVETYPDDTRPVTVEAKLDVIASPATVEVIEDASSVGSIKVLMYVSKPFVVDTKEL